MAKETRAQREEREAAENKLHIEAIRAGWQQRLMDVMLGYTEHNYWRFYREDQHIVFVPDQRFVGYEEKLPVVIALPEDDALVWECVYAIEEAEKWLQRYCEFLAEEKIKADKIAAAVAKLTKEEKELLGLRGRPYE